MKFKSIVVLLAILWASTAQAIGTTINVKGNLLFVWRTDTYEILHHEYILNDGVCEIYKALWKNNLPSGFSNTVPVQVRCIAYEGVVDL